MKSIGKLTEDIINRSPFLRESMSEGLINSSALARKIQREIEDTTGQRVKEGAIIMAIKRISPGTYNQLNVKIKSVLSELGDFLVRSNLADFTYQNSDSLLAKQADMINILNSDKDSFFALYRSANETTIVTLDKYRTTMDQLFISERQVSSKQNLASVTVKLPQTDTDVYGVYYYILKQLAWEGLNITEVFSTAHEFTIIVASEDIDRAFRVLMQMKRGI